MCDAHHMHEGHHKDGPWIPSTQQSVGESQQQRGGHGGFAHAFRQLRSRTPVWHHRHRTHTAGGNARINPDRNTHRHKWEGNSVQQRPHAKTPNHTRHNSNASR
ncbi:hypothetical protein TcCL_Unassigned00735 [Trypanosoma cruzi]|nr:hypothetical protein TcCL_Unassigned00735 [Trypanosoma cruzi]